MSSPPPRQLTPEQRRRAEEDFEKINRMGQRHGVGNVGNQNGMFSNTDTRMPTIEESQYQGSRYTAPWGQRLLHRQSRIIEIFDNDEYFNKDAKAVTAKDFSVQQIFQFYLAQQKRYPAQAFLEVYVHDALQQYSRSRTEYRELNLKVKKVAQLAQKLYNLTLLEDTLNTRLKMGEVFKPPGDDGGSGLQKQ